MSYTAINLDIPDRDRLTKFIKPHLRENDGWMILCHHMTLCMGESVDYAGLVGEQAAIFVDAYGYIHGRVWAARVCRCYTVNGEIRSQNNTPHITLAVNVAAGAKPVESNKIEVWMPHSCKLILRGTICIN